MNYNDFMEKLNWIDAEICYTADPASAKECVCVPYEEWNTKIKPLIEKYGDEQ